MLFIHSLMIDGLIVGALKSWLQCDVTNFLLLLQRNANTVIFFPFIKTTVAVTGR